jgi:hypothetical protein
MGIEGTNTLGLKLDTETLRMHHIIVLNNHFLILILVLLIFGISREAFYFHMLFHKNEASPYFRDLKNKNAGRGSRAV